MSRRGDEELHAWQLRLAPAEDAYAAAVAKAEKISKNDVVRRALRLLELVERERGAGGRLLIERAHKSGKARVQVEVLPIW